MGVAHLESIGKLLGRLSSQKKTNLGLVLDLNVFFPDEEKPQNYRVDRVLYQQVFDRWVETIEIDGHFRAWRGRVDGRLFLGQGDSGTHLLDAAVTLNPTYGVPVITGSTLKGLARAMALESAQDQQLVEVLFGREPREDDNGDVDPGDAGYLIFHDAWWHPESPGEPLVREVLTVHHQAYYAGKQDEPSDMDSPIPVQLLAAQGDFWFVVEGVDPWAERGMALLRHALETMGIGARRHLGYGLFCNPGG